MALDWEMTQDPLPELNRPVVVAAFGGWGDALNVATGLVDFCIKQYEAQVIGTLSPDPFYLYEKTRPVIQVIEGKMAGFNMPDATFSWARRPDGGPDLVFFRGPEPQLNWIRFCGDMADFCKQIQAHTLISLGSMYDTVHYRAKVISGMSSDDRVWAKLGAAGVHPISYNGPGAIHSALQAVCPEHGIVTASLWCHCPYYLQDTQHLGLMAALGRVLAKVTGVFFDAASLDKDWELLAKQIDQMVADQPKLKAIIDQLDVQSPLSSLRPRPDAPPKGASIINLKDFRTEK